MGMHPKAKLQKTNLHHERQNNKKPMEAIDKSTPTVVPIK